MKLFQIAAWLLLVGMAHAADPPGYAGVRVCAKCHEGQETSWRVSAHAQALESLKPGVKAQAKLQAKLDPAKDYTREADCVGCHVTGFGEKTGYRIDGGPDQARSVLGVTCEACHGAGEAFRRKHADAEDLMRKTGEATPRQVLVEAGQNFDYEAACARCHLNYSGSKWSGAKPPYTPFTPALDARYRFDFARALHASGKDTPVHTHYKLHGVFSGAPIPPIRAETQGAALETED